MADHQDIKVHVLDQGDRAELCIDDGIDAAAITSSTLEAAATKAGVVLDEHVQRRLARIAREYRTKPNRTAAVFATARQPVDGANGTLQWQRRFDPTLRSVARAPDGKLKVNHYAGRIYIQVKPGDHVATILPPQPGTDGCDVRGRPLKARPGNPCDVAVSSSFTVDEAGRVLARTGGVLIFENNALTISTLLEVPDSVDFSTGNIDFDGAVSITGDIRAMFTVKASGDLSVGGLIEAATLICGGNFTCQSGMAGKDRGELNVGGNAEIGYLNNVRGRIGGRLTVRREILDCDLKVEGDLVGATATIIGGTLRASGSVVIGTLGTRMNKPTIVHASEDVQVNGTIHAGVSMHYKKHELYFHSSVDGPVTLTLSKDNQPRLVTPSGTQIDMQTVAYTPGQAA